MSKEGNSFVVGIEDAQDLINKLTEFLTAATVRVARLTGVRLPIRLPQGYISNASLTGNFWGLFSGGLLRAVV